MSFLSNLGKNILPKNIRVHIKNYLIRTGLYEVPYKLYGIVFISSFFVTIISYILWVFPGLKTAQSAGLIIGSILGLTITELVILLILFFTFYIYYEFIIFKRTRKIEEVLPDFLEEVSINLRAGMSFDKALWNSIKPEFGILQNEIQIVAKKVMAGEDTEQALREFSTKYKSTLLEESMDMIIVGLRSGSNISEIIDKIVVSVKEAYYLNKELIASVTSYVIFISVIAVIISPLLFALSFNLMELIKSMSEKMSSSASRGAISLSFGANKLNPKDFILFSKVSILIISGISSIIIADLREGSIKAGIKYVLIFMPTAYVVYVTMLTLLTSLFGILI